MYRKMKKKIFDKPEK